MAENKTKRSTASVESFLEAVPDERRREDAKTLSALMSRISGQPAILWGESIVGFGSYAYRYDSGHSGESCRIGFSPRAKQLVLHIVGGFSRHRDLLARFGRHRTGKSCLYIKRLSDIDEAVLETLLAAALTHMRELYPERE